MAFDIYGEHLRPGYCEVHPDIKEEYPCSKCIEESFPPLTYPEPEQPYPEPTEEEAPDKRVK